MTNHYVLSYDFGTSGVKASLVNLEGRVCQNSSMNYPLITPQPGWAEQDPDDYWEACCQVTQQVMQEWGATPEQIKGLAFGTHWKGIIPLDDQDHVLYPTIIWLDGRAGKQAEKLNQRLGTVSMSNREYWPRLMWVKEEMPELYQNTKCFLEVNSFLKFKATGIKVVDATNSFTRATKESLQSYYQRILEAAELDPDKFPPLVQPTDRVGGLTEKAARELGLLAGTPVFGGCGDIPAIAIGAGCSSMGSHHIYLGSSGWFGTVVQDRKEGIGQLYQSFQLDQELMLYAMQSAGMTLNWAIRQFYRAESEALGEGIYDLINQEIADLEPGSDPMIAIPWIHGELPPFSEHAKALFFNVASYHDRRHFISAILEGICFTLRWKLETYLVETGKSVPSIRVVAQRCYVKRVIDENWKK